MEQISALFVGTFTTLLAMVNPLEALATFFKLKGENMGFQIDFWDYATFGALMIIGAQGAAAIYTDGMQGSRAALRPISTRAYTWFSWLYPMPF